MQESQASLGTHLKKLREEKGISIEQVAYATRISLKMLRALEEDDSTALPAPTFVRGYLQAYAKYARLDSQDLLLRYQEHLNNTPDLKKGPIRSHYLYVRERYQEKRRLVMVIVLFATMLSVAGTYFLLKAKREKNKQLTQQAEQILKNTAEPTATASATETETSAATTSATSTETKAAESATKTETATATKSSVLATEVAPAAVTATATTASAVASKTATVTATNTATASATATNTGFDQSKGEKKAYNLLLKTETDVWLRFQTDQDPVKDLTLRSGKAIMLRANSVIKIFSGNLKAFKATLNGAPLAKLTSDPKAKSAVVPESEVPNYPLPLFPQFQTSSSPKTDAGTATSTSTNTSQ
jgi:cytoskeleton protein RodZ